MLESGTAVWIVLGAGAVGPSMWLLFYCGWVAVVATRRLPDALHPMAGTDGPWPRPWLLAAGDRMRDNPVRRASPSSEGSMSHVKARRAAITARVRALREPPASPHETRGASIVRPVVFGATDGLVSNLSLIMGVAGATGAAGQDSHAVVIAGVAGLLAGGFSMAVGEYVSVRSQRELLDYQIDLQRQQLHYTPEQERGILREIYEAKGLSTAEADLIVEQIMRDPERAIDTFVREEIGLSAETMGSPVAAGLGSLCAFALGRIRAAAAVPDPRRRAGGLRPEHRRVRASPSSPSAWASAA